MLGLAFLGKIKQAAATVGIHPANKVLEVMPKWKRVEEHGDETRPDHWCGHAIS